MRFFKSLAACLVGILALCVAQHWFNIPPVPAFSVYLASMLFLSSETDSCSLSRKLAIVTTSLAGIALYGINIYMAITAYPQYGNWFGILLDCITLFAIFGAGVLNLTAANNRQ